MIVASNDSNGINIAQNITVANNIFYHNTDFIKNQINGDAPSLTLGLRPSAPITDVVVKDNIIIGRNNGLRILYADKLVFQNNTVHSGYVMQTKATNRRFKNWRFKNNIYYTKNSSPMFITKSERLNFNDWKSKYNVDTDSKHKSHKTFDLDPVLDVTQVESKTMKFRVTLFNKQGNPVRVTFLNHDISEGTNYKITNIASNEVLSEGTLNVEKEVVFKMGIENVTANNFGVYYITFDSESAIEKKKKSFFKRIFGWLF